MWTRLVAIVTIPVVWAIAMGQALGAGRDAVTHRSGIGVRAHILITTQWAIGESDRTLLAFRLLRI
jgi:hypothetical protein